MKYRYYAKLRPISIGTIPSKPKPETIVNFDNRKMIGSINHQAWGYVEYSKPLDEIKAWEYDLLKDF